MTPYKSEGVTAGGFLTGGLPTIDTSGITINVNGGDPQAVVDALRAYQQSNGSVPIRVSG
jgi:hypothetical protein